MTVGAILRAERLGGGLSLRGLAREVGISPTYMSDIENGKRDPSARILLVLANRLGLSDDIDELMIWANKACPQCGLYDSARPGLMSSAPPKDSESTITRT